MSEQARPWFCLLITYYDTHVGMYVGSSARQHADASMQLPRIYSRLWLDDVATQQAQAFCDHACTYTALPPMHPDDDLPLLPVLTTSNWLLRLYGLYQPSSNTSAHTDMVNECMACRLGRMYAVKLVLAARPPKSVIPHTSNRLLCTKSTEPTHR